MMICRARTGRSNFRITSPYDRYLGCDIFQCKNYALCHGQRRYLTEIIVAGDIKLKIQTALSIHLVNFAGFAVKHTV